MLRRLRRYARDAGLAFLVSLFTLIFLFQPFKVEGTSMMPSLQDQERILVNKVAYDVGTIQRGDLVVFRYPRDPSKTFIKRIIAGPGDVVRIHHGIVWVNGRPLQESYRYDEPEGPGDYGPETVPGGTYFVLGDHRSVSLDSRDWGVVSGAAIFGKAVLRYWPPTQFGPLG
ncbi:MAG: signal peptidase I [Acidobacteriota bacterium]